MSEADCAPASGGAGASPASAGAAVERESKFIPIAGRPITAIVVGAGNRGTVYSNYALEVPARFKIVGVAEPRDWHREAMAKNHSIPADAVWKSWTELAAAGRRLADCVILTTQDRMHREPAVAFAALGYHILLEKPIAVSAEDVKAVVAAVKAAGVHFAVGHVLRFTPYMQRIIGLIRSGAIGEVVNIQHLEPIGAAHFSHSYVRGNWRNEAEASFMLLAKCCHDVDLLRYMMNKPCERVSSFGSLVLFRPDRKPAGAADRCLECPDAVESACAFSAKKIYLKRAESGHFAWPVAPILDVEPSVDAVREALRTGPYGRCAWACDNDVADNQVVSFQFAGGATATLTAVAHSEKQCQRSTRIYGTKGEIEGDGETSVRHFDFLSGKATVYEADGPPAGSALRGHGGADYFLIKAFVDAVSSGDPSHILSGPDETLESHLMVFAAEQARHTGAVVDLRGGTAALMSRDFSW